MLHDTEAIETRYQLFIEQAAAAGLVWGLKNKGGFANSTSAEDEDVTVIPFWSDKALAKACARDDWKGYLPVAVPVVEFLESWCTEMAENGMLAGVNWDANMLGKEASPLHLVLDMLNKLKADNSAIKFENYGSIDDFIAQTAEVPE
ncbi:DUF2750 domain-containing protein [Mucilaginibacter sp. AW1-3]